MNSDQYHLNRDVWQFGGERFGDLELSFVRHWNLVKVTCKREFLHGVDFYCSPCLL